MRHSRRIKPNYILSSASRHPAACSTLVGQNIFELGVVALVEPLSLNLPDLSTLCLAQSERLCRLSASIVTVGIPVSHMQTLVCSLLCS